MFVHSDSKNTLYKYFVLVQVLFVQDLGFCEEYICLTNIKIENKTNYWLPMKNIFMLHYTSQYNRKLFYPIFYF